MCLVLTNFSEVLSLRIKNYVVTNHITEFFRVGDVCVFTTILVIETSEYITTSNVIFGVKVIFKVLVPLEYSCFKGCKLTNCFQTNSSVTLGISNTFVSDLDRNNLTFVFTKGSDDSSRLSTKSITVNVYSRSSGIGFTRVNDSDRYNTTVNHNRLCQSTFTRVQFDLRSRSVSRSSRSQCNARNRTTNLCSSKSTSTATTSNRDSGLRSITSTSILYQNTSYTTISHNCLSSCTRTTTTNDRDQRLSSISRTLIGNIDREQ